MSRIAYEPRTAVEATPRKQFTPKQRRDVYERQNGICGCGCGEAMLFEDMEIDHPLSLFLCGAHAISNWSGLKSAHHRSKTSDDAAIHAKVKRLIRKANPETRKPPKMRSRPFDKSLKRTFSGKVERRFR